jgi:hypothetical protein
MLAVGSAHSSPPNLPARIVRLLPSLFGTHWTYPASRPKTSYKNRAPNHRCLTIVIPRADFLLGQMGPPVSPAKRAPRSTASRAWEISRAWGISHLHLHLPFLFSSFHPDQQPKALSFRAKRGIPPAPPSLPSPPNIVIPRAGVVFRPEESSFSFPQIEKVPPPRAFLNLPTYMRPVLPEYIFDTPLRPGIDSRARTGTPEDA